MKKEFREVKSSETYKGFYLKKGFYINEKLDRIITGFDLFNERDLTGFFINCEGEWERHSFDVYDDETEEIFNKWITEGEIEEWNDALSSKPQGKLHIESNRITFTNVVPGEKCNNGGEYGFYTELIPTKVDGLYEEFTCTTCDFDDCGTGRKGYKWLTEDDYVSLKEKSDKIKEAGSLY